MDLQYGLLMGFMGCVITVVGFFTAFLVINYNKRKKEKKLKEIEESKKGPLPHSYYGDDTV